ncbi:histidine phosphatase family protein [Corynebacterium guangdongense]|uniref:Phosphoglycerate mutase n=1 Tax=Corynebacterium guangdongense TaxID=1783348 RepID=A0ABU2A1C7_9CORY|nr:histidine phosphatase family protein [Corynebacterium guangdongense]MDR7330403.1 putative phosphoglycerate mutase [Corynebacterium guangdongense]WJZ18961.1 Putative phosphoserine phosphatase 2 [Corynebacterium guangdongense]
MTELFLVRHGQTEWSASGQYTSITDLGLTEHGRDEASSLKGLLNPADFDHVLASPRRRAQETAQLAGFGDFEVDEDLAEWFYGDYEGLTGAEIAAKDAEWQIWTHGAPGGESPEDVLARYSRVIDRVVDSGHERIIIFAHGHALRVLACLWMDLPLRYGAKMPLDTATISRLGTYKGRRALMAWNSRLG